MTDATAQEMPPTGQMTVPHWLAHVPVPLFAAVMGLGGLGLAWRKSHHVLGVPGAIGETVLVISALVFVAVVGLYLVKIVRHADEVAAEFRHPIRHAFFPTISVSLVILSIAATPYSHGVATGLWALGAALHLGFTLAIVHRWITQAVELQHINPAWFIPVVGNIVVPVAGVPLGFVELSWLFFGVGIVFWLMLQTLVIYRMIFHAALPEKMVPSLFILLAPPAVGYIAYLQLIGGGHDAVGRILFANALFLVLVLATLGRRFLRVPFFISWWAYTFPSAAMAIAAIAYHGQVAGPGSLVCAIACLTLTSAIVLTVFARTLWALAEGRLFVPE